MKHTPGPWSTRAYHSRLKDEIGVNGRMVATVWVRIEGDGRDNREPQTWHEGEANARLMMAAPDLLEALAEMLPRFDDLRTMAGFDERSALSAKALAAIQKANGTQMDPREATRHLREGRLGLAPVKN